MSKIYLINVGANTSHKSCARSPIFKDETFIYVSFPHPGKRGRRPYPEEARPFVRGIDVWDTHVDPDWENRTYGAPSGLTRVSENDVLLFWALLWENRGKDWQGFTGDWGWWLIGALRVREVFGPDHPLEDARSLSTKLRGGKNVHVDGRIDPGHRVFVGSIRHSGLFRKGVYFEAGEPGGLMFRTLRSKIGGRLTTNGKGNWKSTTRAPRAVWDLEIPEECQRARVIRDAILKETGTDILKGIVE